MFILPFLFVFKALAITVDFTSRDSICKSTALIADGVLDYYEGTRYGGAIGMFTYPYYWWQAGHAFGAMIDNWFLCGNDTYEELIYDALLAQTGKNFDYMPSNQTMTEGNDDQGFWGLTVIAAAERNFTAPKEGPDWLALTQAVYNTMWSRWDNTHCGGGLRWQIFTWNSGYNYKNTISSACLFHISARLARFTGNQTYVNTAIEVYQWLVDVQFIQDDGTMRVFDGANLDENCTHIVHLEWSYNIGIMLGGAAYLYNFTEDPFWLTVTSRFVDGSKDFFRNGIMYERACQDGGNCNNDQRFFKGVFARCLGLTALLVPDLYSEVMPLLETSAAAAVQSCSGGFDGHTCGLNWEASGWDGLYGLGEQVSALETIQSVLVPISPAPLTQKDEGVAAGDIEAGLSSSSTNLLDHGMDIKSGDRAGAGIITAVILFAITSGSIWMVI
jgi:mannan endo-1,6-alpha-mannosidase